MVHESRIKIKGLGIPRRHMPQIKSNVIPEFIRFLSDHGVSVSRSDISALDIRPVQDEIDVEKAEAVDQMTKEKPIIISRDRYVLDGHHRWYNGVINDETLLALKASVDITELLRLARAFPKANFKT